jgi:hypothetical protein
MDKYNADSDDYGYGNREDDTMSALHCLEEALNILAKMGSESTVDEVTDLVNRAYMLVDRHYGETAEYPDEEPLNFADDE